MEKFTTKMVTMMKAENLYASQGGPIILSQVKSIAETYKWFFDHLHYLFIHI